MIFLFFLKKKKRRFKPKKWEIINKKNYKKRFKTVYKIG